MLFHFIGLVSLSHLPFCIYVDICLSFYLLLFYLTGPYFWDRIIAVISWLWGFYRGYRDPRQPAGIQNLQNDVFLDPGCRGSQSVHHWGLSTGIHNSQQGSRLPQAAAPIAAPDRDLTPFNLSPYFHLLNFLLYFLRMLAVWVIRKLLQKLWFYSTVIIIKKHWRTLLLSGMCFKDRWLGRTIQTRTVSLRKLTNTTALAGIITF